MEAPLKEPAIPSHFHKPVEVALLREVLSSAGMLRGMQG
jgi:hypothetical protein